MCTSKYSPAGGDREKEKKHSIVSPGASSQLDDAGSSAEGVVTARKHSQFRQYFSSRAAVYDTLFCTSCQARMSHCALMINRINVQLYGVHLSSCWVLARLRCGLR